MGNYDYRMIEGCHVYSFSVECPARPANGSPKKSGAVRKGRGLRKILLSILLVLLSPFALLLDTLYAACMFVRRRLFARVRKGGMVVGMLGTVSCLLVLSAVLLTVL